MMLPKIQCEVPQLKTSQQTYVNSQKFNCIPSCCCHNFFFPLLNQQSQYKVLYELLCWLSGSLTCRLPNVMRSPPARRSLVSSVTVDWCLALRRWGFYLKSKSTNYPEHGHHGNPSSHKENSHGRAGNRTRDLVISSQKLWPLDCHKILEAVGNIPSHTYNFSVYMSRY